jgi:hypothetical protein
MKTLLKKILPRPVKDALRALRRSGAQSVEELAAALSPAEVDRLVHALAVGGKLTGYACTRHASYNQDGLITYHHSDFLHDSLFQEAYRLGKGAGSWSGADLEWRVYVACWAAAKGKTLEGDFVECGVNRGGLSRAVMHYTDFGNLPGRKFYLLDTYRGFPEEQQHLAASCHREHYRECYEEARATFQDFPNAVLVRGPIPETLSRVPAEKVCYLSLDLNCAEPEVAAAEFFWPRLASGAVMVLDDYGYSDAYLRQKRALDRFARDNGVQVLLLPTGQGLIFKP